jgi:hypothetical protein
VAARVVAGLLEAHAAVRERTADEHMFSVSMAGHPAGSFRLQLFTASGARPVAVVTQMPDEGGSLTNRAEVYAAEVWRRVVPDLAEPPLWVTLELRPGRVGARPERFRLVTFDVAGRHDLGSPRWCGMTDEDLARLVGVPVTRDRGEGYRPWPQGPDPEPTYRVAWTLFLPRPRGMDRGCIRAVPSWWRCLARQAFPCRMARDCCYYHSIDWRRVSAAAIRITRQARREGLSGRALSGRADELAGSEGLAGEEQLALAELLSEHSAIVPGRPYGNGRHRVTVMLGVGVRRTVIIRWRYPR